MGMNYTERVDGFQIRDVMYLGLPPADTQPKYDIVKWEKYDKPLTNVIVFKGDQVLTGQTVYESCYSVASLEWNRHEGGFDFNSVGLRWLEAKPTEAAVQMILDFAEKKGKELAEHGDRKGCSYYAENNKKPYCTHHCDGCEWYV